MSSNIIPTDNDVLMGRGARTRDHLGNKRFQSIVRQYRESYAATRTYKEKDAVANEVLARLREQDPPGRFLTDNSSSNVTQNGASAAAAVWSEVVDNKKIMEKIKQALREPEDKSSNRQAVVVQETKQAVPEAAAGMRLSNPPPAPPASASLPRQLLPFYHATDPNTALEELHARQKVVSNSLLLPSFLSGGYRYGGIAPLFGLAQFDRPHSRPKERNGSLQGDRPEANEIKTQDTSAFTDTIAEQTDNNRKKKSHERVSPTSTNYSSDTSSLREDLGHDLDPEEIVAARLLSSSLSEKVRQARAVLEQDEKRVTQEEKEQAMVDLFGSLCEVNQSKKRIQRVAVETDISVLLKEMKRELDAIPSIEKLALLEAQKTALPVEFSDRRLERFLRVEDMDPKRAARRFVTYWKERWNLFGPDKFCLPMTLNGALRDDHACLESGPFYLAPALDASGRAVSGFFFNRMKSDKYDIESIGRCWWFLNEVASKHPNARKPFFARVAISNLGGASLWDTDLKHIQRMEELKEKAVPIKDQVTHSCNMSRSIYAIAKPLALLTVKRDTRLRKVFHDCREDEIAEVLQQYGIPSQIIPKEMGGQCDFDTERKKWLVQLRKLDTRQALESDEFIWWEL